MMKFSNIFQKVFILSAFFCLPILLFAQPANDDCSSATALTIASSCSVINATTIDATDSGVTHACGSYTNFDVWFSFIAPVSGNVYIQTSNRTFDDVAIVYDDCAGTNQIACDDGFGDTNIEMTDLMAGSTYYVVVHPFDTSGPGTFDICAFEPSCFDFVADLSIDNADCANDLYDIVIDLTDLGLATSVSITHDGFNTSSIMGITAPGMQTLSGFTSGDGEVVVTITDDNDALCFTEFTIDIPAQCPPANDDCNTATPLTVSNSSCGNPVQGSNQGATDSGVAHACGGYEGGDVWFSFVAPASGLTTIETSDDGSGNFDTVIEVYDGCMSLVSVDCDDDGSGNFSIVELSGLTAGATYYVAVWEFSNNNFGTFDICAWDPSTCLTAPSGTISIVNQDCMAGTYDIVVEVTDLGVASAVDINHDGSSAGSFTNVGLGMHTLTGFNVSDLFVAIKISNTADDFCFTEIVNELPVCPPINDDCDNPIALTVAPNLDCTNAVQATIAYATASSEPVTCFNNPTRWEDDVWFSFVATSNIHQVQIQDIQNGFTDLIFQLAEGDCSTLTELFCHDSPNAGFITPSLTIGNTYLLRIASFSTTQTTTVFDICIGTPPPSNDDCAGATPLTVSNSSCGNPVQGSNQGATDSGLAHACGGYEGGDVWFSFVAPASGFTTIETSDDGSGNFDTVIEVYDGCMNVMSVDCNDDGGSGNFSIVELSELTADATYYVAVWEFSNNDFGTFDICAFEPSCFDFVADLSIDNSDCANDLYDIVIDLTDLALATSVSITHDGSNTSSIMGITAPGMQTLSGFTSADGEVVVTITDDNDALCFTEFTIDIPTQCPPPNDDCIGAINLPMGSLTCGNTISGTNLFATDSGIDHNNGSCISSNNYQDHDVWFSFVAPTSGEVTVQTSNLVNIDDVVIVYDACEGMNEVGCSNLPTAENIIMTGLTAGQTYYVAVFSFQDGPEGTFDICAFDPNPVPPPSNDDCGDAVVMDVNTLFNCNVSYAGTTENATASPNSPACGIGDWSDDVWYTFTMPADVINFGLTTTGNSTNLNASIAIYSINDCSVISGGQCFETDDQGNFIVALSSVVGDQFYIRISTDGSVPGGFYEFDFCLSEYCFEDIELTGDNLGGIVENDIESNGLIESTQTILSGAIVDYDSETEIDLNAGFEVELGATFEAFIDGCDNGGGGSNILGEGPDAEENLRRFMEEKGYPDFKIINMKP